MNARPLLLVPVAFALACGPTVPPLKPLPPPPPPSAAEQVAAQNDDQSAMLYTYTPVGKRDPFRDTTLNRAVLHTADHPTGIQQPLQKFEIDQLHLQLTETGTSSPMALILDPNGRGHFVHIGDFVGRNWGKVSHIGRDELTITETIADQQTGKVYPSYVPMRMPKTDQEKQQEENLNEDTGGKL